MLHKAEEFLVKLRNLAIECDVAVKLTDSDDILMAPTYKEDGGLDEWFVVGVNPYRQYDFKIMTQEKTQNVRK